jgi:hypothetical protein
MSVRYQLLLDLSVVLLLVPKSDGRALCFALGQ